MQGSFGMSLGSKDEAVSFVYSVESPLSKEDDARNVDIRTVRASNASEPSLQAMARATHHPTISWPSGTIAFTSLVVWSTTL